MIFTRDNLYNPFKDSLIGILHKETFAPENLTDFVIENINLYHQPVIEPKLATLFSIIMITLLVFGEYLHIKILRMLRKENSILRDITYVFVFANMTLCVLNVFLITSTNFVHPLNKIIGQWFCTMSRFFEYFLIDVMLLHSFCSALMRYLFLVHAPKVELYGKDKVQKAFLLSSILIPLLLALWKVNDGSELDSTSFINKCNGKHHEVFLVETSTLNVLKKNFCELGNTRKGPDLYGYVLSLLKQLSCVASTAVMLIMASNVTEGIIYYRLFSYTNRRHNESMRKLRNVLTDSSKDMRHRRNLINIHITFLGWLVEFLGFFIIVLGSFILGHISPTITLCLQTFSIIIQYIILPLVYLINDTELKGNVAASRCYIKILELFNCQHYTQTLGPDQEEDYQDQGIDENEDDEE